MFPKHAYRILSLSFTRLNLPNLTETFYELISVGMTPSMRVEQALLGWIPVNSRLCGSQLDSSVRTWTEMDTCNYLLIVSARALTDFYPDEAKDEFYRKFVNLNKAEYSNIILTTIYFNTQIGSLNQNERHLSRCFDIPTQKVDDSNCLLQISSDSHLLLSNTNFRHKERHSTW